MVLVLVQEGAGEAWWGGRIRRVRRSSTLHQQQLLTGLRLLTNCQGRRSHTTQSAPLHTHTHTHTEMCKHMDGSSEYKRETLYCWEALKEELLSQDSPLSAWLSGVTCHVFTLAARLADWTGRVVCLTQTAVMALLQREACFCIPQVSWLGGLPSLLAQPVFLSLPFPASLSFSFKWRHMTLGFTAKYTSLCRPRATTSTLLFIALSAGHSSESLHSFAATHPRLKEQPCHLY